MATATFRPNAAGDSTQWSRAGADSGSNWGQVDESVANDATDYVIEATLNEQDLYNIPNHTTEAGTINSVTISFRIAASGAASQVIGISPLLKEGGTTTVGTQRTATTPGGGGTSAWATWTQTWTTNPRTGSAWTWSEIDSLQIGQRLTQAASASGWCTQNFIDVDYDPFVTDQKHFRVYSDDGAINAGTAQADEDVTSGVIEVGDNFRLRIQVANTGGTAGSISRRLEFKEDSGAWTAIASGSGNVRLSLSSNFADTDATTSRLTATGSFQAGQGKESGATTSSITLNGTSYVEDEWCLAFQTGALGKSYQFRVTNAGTALATYTITPTINPINWMTLPGIFRYTSGDYSSPSGSLAFALKTNAAIRPAYMRLYNKTDSTIVTDSKQSTTSTSTALVESGNLIGNLTTAKNYVGQVGIAKGGTLTYGDGEDAITYTP